MVKSSCVVAVILGIATPVLASDLPVFKPDGVPNPESKKVVGAWQMPKEFRPSQSVAGEYVATVPGLGKVRGDRHVLASVSSPLRDKVVPPHQAWVACVSLITKAASDLGSYKVEAASAGPVRPLDNGGVETPVTVRILYPSRDGYELKQATIGCQVDAANKPFATPVL